MFDLPTPLSPRWDAVYLPRRFWCICAISPRRITLLSLCRKGIYY